MVLHGFPFLLYPPAGGTNLIWSHLLYLNILVVLTNLNSELSCRDPLDVRLNPCATTGPSGILPWSIRAFPRGKDLDASRRVHEYYTERLLQKCSPLPDAKYFGPPHHSKRKHETA